MTDKTTQLPFVREPRCECESARAGEAHRATARQLCCLKIADAFEVSLDYLVGEGINSKFDKKTVTRLQDIEKLDHIEKEHVFAMLDAFLAKSKLQAILK